MKGERFFMSRFPRLSQCFESPPAGILCEGNGVPILGSPGGQPFTYDIIGHKELMGLDFSCIFGHS
jgi:hypothetical protein